MKKGKPGKVFMPTSHCKWYCTLAVVLYCGAVSAPLSAQSDVANATNKAALNKIVE